MGSMLGRAIGSLAMCLALGDAAAADDLGDASVSAMAGDSVLYVSGVIGPNFERDVATAIALQRGIRRIVIDSPGGLRAQALRVGALAERLGIAVRIDGQCASACVLLWATADRREITAGSRIGLHRSSLADDLPIDAATRERLMRRNDDETIAVLRDARFPAPIVHAAASTPAHAMTWFDASELAALGAPFAAVAAARHAPQASDGTSPAHVMR